VRGTDAGLARTGSSSSSGSASSAHAASSSALSAPPAIPRVYGVEQPATVAEAEAAAAAAAAEGASPAIAPAFLRERALAAEERRRLAQRPETGEDLLDALAQRTQRRSAVPRRRGGDLKRWLRRGPPHHVR